MAFLKFNKSELVNLSYSLKREVLCANENGAYSNTSIAACNTRRYHGLLAVPVEEFMGSKHLLLSSIDDSLIVNERQFNLGIHCYGDVYEPRGHKYIIDFNNDSAPKLIYKVGETIFSKTLIIVPDTNQIMIKYEVVDSPEEVTILLNPFLAFRNIHSLTKQNDEANTSYRTVDNGVAFRLYEGYPELYLQLSNDFNYSHSPMWYNDVTYSDEYRRGFDCTEDLLVPGSISFKMKKGSSVVLSASVVEVNPKGLKRKFSSIISKLSASEDFYDILVENSKLLICDSLKGKKVCAGYSWLETGLLRETIMSLSGLTLYAGAPKKEFEEILDNLIAENEERLYHRTTQIEAPLRLTDTIQQYIEFTGEEKRIWNKYGRILKRIIESYSPGMRNEVSIHPNGLLWAQKERTALSWMNAYIDGWPVSERAGYQVETNGMWFNALSFALEMEKKYSGVNSNFVKNWESILGLVNDNFFPVFWNDELRYLADYVDNNGQHMDARPNQLFAISLDYSPVPDEYKALILQVIGRELVTKRGIRTLSPRNVKYKGVYEGSQNERDLAYHQGCAYPWLLAPYFSIAFKIIGPSFYKKAEYLTEGFYDDISKHGVGLFAELYDGDPPHEPHGAISSATSTAALLRIDYLMKKYSVE